MIKSKQTLLIIVKSYNEELDKKLRSHRSLSEKFQFRWEEGVHKSFHIYF